MISRGFLRAHVCLTATTTALFAGTACEQAHCSQTHTLKHGETVEFLGHHYHVAIKDILAANHLSATDVLRDGRSLYIPDAPRPTHISPTMRKEARIKGDRISVRMGPASSRHRVRLCDDGARLLVTAEQDGWLQVTLEDGRIGWVRSDFVHFPGGSLASSLARRTPRPRKDGGSPVAAVALAGGRERSHVLAALDGRSRRIARKQHEERLPIDDSAARLKVQSGESAGTARHRHGEIAARSRHQRHILEVAAAKRHELAAHRHAVEVAAARRHHKHEAEAAATHHRQRSERLAEARHEKHLREIAEARHQQRLHEIAAARHRHGSHAEHLAAIAAARRHHLAALANAHHRHLAEETAHARRARHHEEVAAAQHRHHLAALANARHRHLVAIANHERRAALASARHHDGASYAHRIRPEAESPSASNDVVRSAFAYRGTPYRWGESRPGGFDCSGFTKYIYGRKGVTLPRTAAEQYHAGHAVAHKGMKPGDLVFFHTTRSGISHVGMYVGNGKFVHSSSKGSGGVRVDNLESGYYSKAFRGARRVRKETTESSGE